MTSLTADATRGCARGCVRDARRDVIERVRLRIADRRARRLAEDPSEDPPPPRTFAFSRFLARSRAPSEALRGAPLGALVVPGRHRVRHAAHAPLARLRARVGAGGAAHRHARVRRGILSTTSSHARVPDRNGSRSVSRAPLLRNVRTEGNARDEGARIQAPHVCRSRGDVAATLGTNPSQKYLRRSDETKHRAADAPSTGTRAA